MIYSTDEIRYRIQPIAQKYQLRSIYLFGSYARNEATDKSDMDMLVDTTGSIVKGWIIGGLYNDLCEVFGRNIDLITTNALTQDSERMRGFTDNVLKDRVLIYEKH